MYPPQQELNVNGSKVEVGVTVGDGVVVGVGQTLEPVSADKHKSQVLYSVSAV